MPRYHKRPAYYAAPLRSRKAIIDFLTDHENYYRWGPTTTSPLAWDVKARGVDFDADHLIEVYRTSGEYNPKTERWLDYPEWREPALAKYEEIKDRLWEWATEAACENVTDSDCYRNLWNGTTLDVEYGFAGRSGGWLLMIKYEGTDLTKMDPDDFWQWLDEMPYGDLRNLYQLVVQNDHDFRTKAVEEELEYQAAWAWIENCCRDIPRPEKTQAELPLGV